MRFDGFRRRDFIMLLSGAAVVWPRQTSSQQVQQVRKIGLLVPAAAATPHWERYVGSFKEGLQKLGWSNGSNIRIDERWSASADELAIQAVELATLSPDVILSAAASATKPMHQATRTVPIVFANVPDPVANGFVTSLARPGGNITGLTLFATEQSAKRASS